MIEYPKEFLELVQFRQESPHGGMCVGGFDLPMIFSIYGLSVRVERSGCVRNQLMQREVALAGLFAAWNKQKEIEGK